MEPSASPTRVSSGGLRPIDDGRVQADAPDTVRDRQLGGTEPLPALGLAPVATAPLAEPVRVATTPLAMPAGARATVSYDVYSPDDTLRAKQALQVDLASTARRQRLGVGALGVALALVTTLAAFGSCEDRPTAGLVETTSASLPATTNAAPPPPGPTNVTPLEPMSTPNAVTTFAPPLPPVTPGPRRRTARPPTKK